MILLISNAKNREECASGMNSALSQEVMCVSGMQQGVAKLRISEFDAVVVDQSCAEGDPVAAESLWRVAASAPVISVNFAISSLERIGRDVRAALARRRHEQIHAARHAQAALRNELAGPISGILLSSELALSQPALPSAVVDKLRSVHQLALEIKTRLGAPAESAAKL
jgi:hypothetical protein